MIDYESLIVELERSQGLYVTIKDHGGVLAYQNTGPLREHRKLHSNPFCTWKRQQHVTWQQQCHQTCNIERREQAQQQGKSFVSSPCYKGLVEMVIPIFHEHQMLFAFMVGNFSTSSQTLPLNIWGQSPDWNPQESPALTPERFHYLDHFFKLLGEQIKRDWQKTPNQISPRAEQILKFFKQNAHKKIQLHDLSQALFLSESRTKHVVHQELNTSFTKLLLNERIERAKNLLKHSSYSLSDIARQVGFSSPFYMSRQFKQITQQSPRDYRKQHHATNPKNDPSNEIDSQVQNSV